MPHDPHQSAHPASRRDFLRSSAAVLGAGAVMAAAAGAFGQDSKATVGADIVPPAPAGDARTLRIGVIGLGGPGGCAMGLGHALSLIELAKQGKEKVEITAVCDLNQLHLDYGMRHIAEAQPGVKVAAYTKHNDLLAHEGLDGVIIAVPEHWHAQVAIDALERGRDLYLEKPMTLNLADAIALNQASLSHPNVIAQIGTQATRHPKFHEARRLIKEGVIGTPTFSQTSYCRNSKEGEWHYAVNPDWKPGVNLDWDYWCGPLGAMPWDPKVYYQWRRYRRTSTGIIGDLLVHVMTPMLLAIDQGWPVRVAATGGHLVDKAMENHDNINICAQFETGHQMMVCGSTCNEVGLETLIRGHRGNIYLGSRHCEVRPERPYSEEMDPLKIECPDIGNDQDVHRLGWLHSIRTREKPLSGIDLGLKVMVIVDLATRSMWEGGAFTFDPKTMKAARA
ncbi:MAG TPA: Gfo/Idh/MocA family oxidoreductase [Phycisphaerales bacterium]|nr:Gfo/Idh/MocA family oxidoreductase [Phycisphaerales bacterium]